MNHLSQKPFNFFIIGTDPIKMLFSYLNPTDFIHFGQTCKKTLNIRNQILDSNNHFSDARRVCKLHTDILKLRLSNSSVDINSIKKAAQVELSLSYQRRNSVIHSFSLSYYKYASQLAKLGFVKFDAPILVSNFLDAFKFFKEENFTDVCFVKTQRAYLDAQFAIERIDQAHYLNNRLQNNPAITSWPQQEVESRCNYLAFLTDHLFKKGIAHYFAFLRYTTDV